MVSRQMGDIYRMLSEHEYQTAEALGESLGVSSKTVRNQLKNLNELLSDFGVYVESKHGTGYRLVVEDTERRKELEAMMQKKELQESGIPNSSEERVEYLLEYLLNTDGYVKLDELSEMLYISKKTLTGNLKEVENLLKEYHLCLQRKPNYGIRVEGREFDRRLCIAGYVARKVQLSEKLDGDQDVTEEIQWIHQCVQNCLSRYSFDISSVAFQNLVLHIQIAILRMRGGHYVPMMESESDKIRDKKTYRIAEDILGKIKEKFLVDFPDSEIGYIAIHLEGKKMLINTTAAEETEGNLIISQEISDLVGFMLSAVYDAFKFDFRDDLELRMSLSQHLVPLVVRLQHDMKLTNPLLRDIRERYSLAYSMATTSCVILNHKYHKIVKEDEIGYIALLFALALERKKTEIAKKNILLVCASGKGSAQLLLYRYKTEFGPYINKISVCDVGRIQEQDFTDIDYIFTTVPIPVKVPVPIQEVEYFLKNSDVQAVKRTLMGKTDSPVLDIYPKDLFLPHMKFGDKDEALRTLCGFVYERGLVPKEFLDSVRAREVLAKTAFGNSVAMPHPIEVMGKSPFVCVAVLDEPILWTQDDPDSMIQVIFLVSVANYENFDVQKFYQVTAKLLLDGASMRELIRTPTYETLKHLLLKMEQQVEEEI
ncbi:MAG: BglG family transcription antiterminator [Hungatella sp.]|jgi:lichenan operon transcriptional antiterminator|nr:BglG family transcription antiterminator [Hungatella sp.]